MGSGLPHAIKEAIERLSKLPGIGPKSAERLAIHLVGMEIDSVQALADAIVEMKLKIDFCEECGNLAEDSLCAVCMDPGRDRSVICVVEQPVELFALEKAGEYAGLYHVLGGTISPLDGVMPEDLTIDKLVQRVKKLQTEEVILGLNPDLSGDTTCLYIADALKDLNVRVTQIARGLPIGGQLDFADQATIGHSLKNRRPL